VGFKSVRFFMKFTGLSVFDVGSSSKFSDALADGLAPIILQPSRFIRILAFADASVINASPSIGVRRRLDVNASSPSSAVSVRIGLFSNDALTNLLQSFNLIRDALAAPVPNATLIALVQRLATAVGVTSEITITLSSAPSLFLADGTELPILTPTAAASESASSAGFLPLYVYIAAGIGGLAVVGGFSFFVIRGRQLAARRRSDANLLLQASLRLKTLSPPRTRKILGRTTFETLPFMSISPQTSTEDGKFEASNPLHHLPRKMEPLSSPPPPPPPPPPTPASRSVMIKSSLKRKKAATESSYWDSELDSEGRLYFFCIDEETGDMFGTTHVKPQVLRDLHREEFLASSKPVREEASKWNKANGGWSNSVTGEFITGEDPACFGHLARLEASEDERLLREEAADWNSVKEEDGDVYFEFLPAGFTTRDMPYVLRRLAVINGVKNT